MALARSTGDTGEDTVGQVCVNSHHQKKKVLQKDTRVHTHIHTRTRFLWHHSRMDPHPYPSTQHTDTGGVYILEDSDLLSKRVYKF